MIKGVKKVNLTTEAILQKISEFDIFRWYMPEKSWKINQATYSPFRRENNPSFVIGNKHGKLSFIDFADTSKRGDCFEFVKQLYNLSTMNDVLRLIDKDLVYLVLLQGNTRRSQLNTNNLKILVRDILLFK